MDKKKLHFGIIGFGYWGPNYARVISSLPNAKLDWICDLDHKSLNVAKKNFFEVRITDDYKNILRDKNVGSLIISTPTSTHALITKDVLNAGKHVLVEKPLANSFYEAKELVKVAKKRHLILLTGHTFLFHPAVSYLKEIIDKGHLGNLLFFLSQRTNLGPIRSDVNALWDLAPHDISTILYLSGAKPISVSAVGSKYLRNEREDIVSVNLKLSNNIFANILVSWLAPVKARTLTIVGDRKMAVFDDVVSGDKVKIVNKRIVKLTKGEPIPFFKFKQLSNPKNEFFTPKIKSKEPLLSQVLNFIELIENQDYLPKSKHALEVVNVLEKAQRSLEMGGRMVLI